MNLLFSNHIYEFVSALKETGLQLFVPDNAKRQGVEESSSVHIAPAEVLVDKEFSAKWLLEYDIDVVYAQGRSSLVFFSKVADAIACEKKVKVIATCHTGYVWGVWWKALAFLTIARAKNASVIFLADSIRKKYSWFVKLIGLKNWVVQNPVDIDRFGCKIIKRQGDKIRFGSVGIITPNKGQDILIEAIEIVYKTGHNVHLTIVGDVDYDWYYKSLNDMVRRRSLQDVIEIKPGLPYDEIPNFLGTLDCYICSSKVEVLPFNILEAMAARLPIVSSNVGGIPDLIESGVNGYLLDDNTPESVASAICKLLNQGLLRKMGRASFDKANRAFSNSVYAAKMLRILGATEA